MAVESITPFLVNVTDDISANGVIEAKDTASVSAKLTGVAIEQVMVEVGDVVKAGQVLATLDAGALQDNLVQAQADLAVAKANHEKAQADLARVLPLLEIDAISRQQVDAYQTALKQAQASQVSSQARLNIAKKNLNDSQVLAPVSGIISVKNAQIGTLVDGTPLFNIIKNKQLEWQATLDAQDALRIQVGQVAQVMVGDRQIEGQVTHLSPITNSGREIVVHVLLPIDDTLKAGMYQEGRFILNSQQRLAIPVSAVMSSDGYDYVWVLDKQTQSGDDQIYQVHQKNIQTGSRLNDKVVVDLPANTLIVASSASFLSENDLVKVVNVVN